MLPCHSPAQAAQDMVSALLAQLRDLRERRLGFARHYKRSKTTMRSSGPVLDDRPREALKSSKPKEHDASIRVR